MHKNTKQGGISMQEKELLENDGTMSDSYSGDGNCISAGKKTQAGNILIRK